MNTHKLVKMANDIAAYFDAEPDRATAIDGVAGHLRRFWDPRMRQALVDWQDEHRGEGLSETARAAIAVHRDRLLSRM